MNEFRGDAASSLDQPTLELVRAACDASSVEPGEVLQPLWSGFGRVQRIAVTGAAMPSAILKLVDTTAGGRHPHGWDTDRSRQRKRDSYAVEARWYRQHASRCDADCRVPALFGAFEQAGVHALVLEDLDGDFPDRRASLDVDECVLCLRWLAHFHARFLDSDTDGLWPQGSYWHLATRPDEFDAMPESPLRRAAGALDQALQGTRFRTLVHGDAKVANFCFDRATTGVAALDFQYVGGGCGMRDVVYLLGSALPDAECRRHEKRLLDGYFAALAEALSRTGRGELLDALEAEWRGLYEIAWADFLRFLLGWMPTHRKVSPYAEELAERALRRLAHAS